MNLNRSPRVAPRLIQLQKTPISANVKSDLNKEVTETREGSHEKHKEAQKKYNKQVGLALRARRERTENLWPNA